MSSPPVSFSFTSWNRRRAESLGSLHGSLAGSSRRHQSPGTSSLSQGHSSQQQHQQHFPAGDSILSSSATSGGHREPIRSFINATHRDHLAPVSSAQYARSVREDTAELATYQLVDKAGGQNTFPLNGRSSQSSRAMISSDVLDLETEEIHPRPTMTASGVTHGEEIIDETSELEPPSQSSNDNTPSTLHTNLTGLSGPSLLAHALRNSPTQHRDQLMTEGAFTAVFADDNDDGGTSEDASRLSPSRPWPEIARESRPATEQTPLLDGSHIAADGGSLGTRFTGYDVEGQKASSQQHNFDYLRLPFVNAKQQIISAYQSVRHPKNWDQQTLFQNVVVAPVSCLPAVIVGLLLNILDALSYGMILFPLGTPLFSHLGSAGISIFYVSTIISQLVFSSGSIFRGGVGSELIEVVPFFHNMALTITDIVGEDNPDSVIATTITSYALSSMVTGSVFYLMGRFQFGYIVGFIPRHILIGCIGGVGWFLVATGFEVTARIDGSLEYNLETLHKLMQLDTVPLWIAPLTLSLVLFWGQKYITSKYFLPLYILAIPAFFYCFALVIRHPFDTSILRHEGWVFEGPPANEPWWYFYTLYKFDQVHWGAIIECVPAMFALTFFGILHVPINVPALALNIGEDHADLNHELKLHGISNFLSGCIGSIQNYLVYANTLFFMRSGGNSRLAGFELAGLTFGVMLIGPKIIGFIPIMMVGCLIFDLGFELLVEAVWEPRKKLKFAEYVTVVAIVLIMGIYDFVVGIGVGILLAFVSLIFQASQVSAVRSVYSGETVSSTVRRNPSQHNYLRKVGRQICIIKLAGYLFFGTIASVESKIRELISDDSFNQRPIRYLIIDLRQVTGLDYSAGEAFNTISRLLDNKGIQLVLSSVDAESKLGRDLRTVGLGEDGIEVAFLPEINTALELCENELLKTLYLNQETRRNKFSKMDAADTDPSSSASHAIATAGKGNSTSPPHRYLLASTTHTGSGMDLLASSPRRSHLQAAARELLDTADDMRRARWQNFSEPLRLMLQIFEDTSDKTIDFWFQASRYFVRREYGAGEMLFQAGAPAEGFFLLEKGIVRAEYDLAHGQCYHESIVAGTTCGELPFFSETRRTATAYADFDCTVWVLERDAWQRLQHDHVDVASELLRVSLKLTAERMATVPSSTMLMAD